MNANALSPLPSDSGSPGGNQFSGPGRFKPIDPVRLFRQNLRLLIAMSVVGVVLGLGVWASLRAFLPWFTSEAQLVVNPGVVDPYEAPDVQAGNVNFPMLEASMRTEVMLIMSEGVLRDALDKPEVQSTNWYQSYENNTREAREQLQEDHLSVFPVRDSQLITLKVRTRKENDPDKILSGIINVYLRKKRINKEETSSDVRRALVEERERAEEKIRRIQDRIREFTVVQKLTSLDVRASEASINLRMMSQQNTELQLALDASKQTYKSLREFAASGEEGEASAEAIAEVEARGDMLRIKYAIDMYQQQLEVARVKFGESHYTTKNIRIELAAYEDEYDRELGTNIREREAMMMAMARRSIDQYEGQIAALIPKMQESTQRMTDLNALLTQYEQLEQDLLMAMETREFAEAALSKVRLASERRDAIKVQLQSPATTPELTFPRPEIVVPAVTIFILGAVTSLIFLREMADQRIKSPVDIGLLPDIDLLGVLPDVEEDPSGPITVERVVEKYPTGLMAESFRQVRTSILSKMDRRGYKTLLVMSAQSGCGTSSVTHNLAASLAYNGRSVVIVDANFRRPSQHRLMGFANNRGLVEVLRNGSSVADALHPVEGLNVSVLATGQASDAPPELLEGDSFRSLLSQLESQFDLVLVDAPPALLASDSQMLSRLVDAIVVVLRAGRDKRGMVERMLKQVDGQRADVLGVVLNGAYSSAGGYFRQSYRDFYRYRENSSEINGEAINRGKTLHESETS